MSPNDKMPLWIIRYGRPERLDIIEAYTEDDALMIATELSLGDGMLDDDLADTVWVEPYDRDLALEYGLKAAE